MLKLSKQIRIKIISYIGFNNFKHNDLCLLCLSLIKKDYPCCNEYVKLHKIIQLENEYNDSVNKLFDYQIYTLIVDLRDFSDNNSDLKEIKKIIKKFYEYNINQKSIYYLLDIKNIKNKKIWMCNNVEYYYFKLDSYLSYDYELFCTLNDSPCFDMFNKKPFNCKFYNL
jgi:hypothetical protein